MEPQALTPLEQCSPDLYQVLRSVSECECDFARRLTMGGLLRLVQEASTRHCTLLNITGEDYRRTGTAFLLAKLCARIYTDIPAEAQVRLETRPTLPIRAVFHRYTTLTFPGADSPAAAVDARWVLVDIESRRILRRPPEGLHLPFTNPSVPEFPILIPKPQGEPEATGRETAGYSRCDQNRHLNNTRYADIICDHLPLEQLRMGPLRELTICYHRELTMGHAMEILRQETEPGLFYLAGREGEQTCFEAAAVF